MLLVLVPRASGKKILRFLFSLLGKIVQTNLDSEETFAAEHLSEISWGNFAPSVKYTFYKFYNSLARAADGSFLSCEHGLGDFKRPSENLNVPILMSDLLFLQSPRRTAQEHKKIVRNYIQIFLLKFRKNIGESIFGYSKLTLNNPIIFLNFSFLFFSQSCFYFLD